MRNLKDGIRSIVRVSYDDKIYKKFKGTDADKRYANEIKILKILGERKCKYVPELLGQDDEILEIVTTNCGQPVTRLSKEKIEKLFKELEKDYGVRHDDQDKRNITYNPRLGRFCLIDFELAELVW